VASLPIYDRNGKEVGQYEVDPSALAPRINRQLLHDVVVMYQANRRQGSARTKGRSDVEGSTKKLYRQKGTGNARVGNRRTNLRRGGGVAFAKRAKDWSYRLPRKAVQLATRMAVASRIQDNEVVLIDELKFEEPKTAEMAGILQAIGLAGKSVLIVVEQYDPIAYKSARNLQGAQILPESDLNALDVLRPRKVLATKAAMERFIERATAAAAVA